MAHKIKKGVIGLRNNIHSITVIINIIIFTVSQSQTVKAGKNIYIFIYILYNKNYITIH